MNPTCRLLLLVCCIPLFAACDKDNLPKPTQSGENTMGAMVNGKKWVASPCWGCTGNGSGKSAKFILSNLSISGQESRGESNIYIFIRLNSINSLGIYMISNGPHDNISHGISISYQLNIATGTRYYYANPDHTFKVTITKFDHNNKVVSGTFSGTLRNVMDHDDTLTVTNGRFDLIFDTH